MKLWKKAHDGFMPRLGNKQGKELQKELDSLPKLKNIQDCLEVLGLHNMMVLGESIDGKIAMYNATFCGKHDSKTYFVTVPQEKGNEYKPTDENMIECKEWEVLKFMVED